MHAGAWVGDIQAVTLDMKDPVQIPGFELLEKLGQGGVATVWKARQVSLDRIVAVKLLSLQTDFHRGDQERLLLEAHAAAQLKHPGIVQVYDAGIVDGASYFVMEYVAGYSIGQLLRRKRILAPEDALAVIECVAEALDHAWKTVGLIHCDVKPDNIMVDLDGTIKVADLGLARMIGTVCEDDPGKVEIMGTPGFISPEQSGGLSDLDCRADIYSLGATLYNLTTGKRLFERYADSIAMDMHVTDHESDALLLCPDLPLGICWLIEKMLVKNRVHRYQDWDAVLTDVQLVKNGDLPLRPFPLAGSSTVTRSEQRTRLTRAWDHRRALQQRRSVWARRIPVLMGVLLLTLAALGLGAAAWRARRISESAQDVVPPDPSGPPPPLAGEPATADHGHDLYHFVMDWIEEYPDQYDEALRRLQRVVEGTHGTRYALMAEDAIVAVQANKAAAIEAAYREVLRRLETLADAQLYREAAALAQSYDGHWGDELRPRLQRRAAELEQRAEAQAVALAEQARAADSRFERLQVELTDILLERTVAEAMQHLDALVNDPSLHGRQADVLALMDCLRALQELDREVLQSFVPQMGSEVTIEFAQGPSRTVFVTGVRAKEGRLRVAQRLEGGARVDFEFGVHDLAVREYRARLGAIERPEVALVSGLDAFREKKYSEAAVFFDKTHPLLASSLAERARRAQQAVREERAQQEFERLLQELAVTARPPDFEAIIGTVRDPDFVRPPPALRGWIEHFRQTHQDTEFLSQSDAVLSALLAGLDRATARAASPATPSPPVAAVAAGRELDERSLAVVSEMLRSRNPGLAEHEIRVLRDGNQPPYGIEINSGALRDIGPLAELPGLRVLICRGVDIGDLTALSALTGLEELFIAGASTRDFQPLLKLGLRKLALPRSGFSDVGILRNMPLQELDLSRTAVRDLSGLRGVALRALNIENTGVFALHGLSGMPLEQLNLSGTQVKDISWLRGMPLQDLNLSRTGIFDFSVLRAMNLRVLNVAETQFRDLSLLAGMPLQHLDLASTRIGDVAALRDLPLRHLSLRNTPVRDLTPLRGTPIQVLTLDQCRGIRGLEFSAGMPLRELRLSGSGVESLSALQAPELQALFMEDTAVTDISPLRGLPLRLLHLRRSPISDYAPLVGLPLEELTLDMRSDAARQIVGRIRSLRRLNGGPWPPPAPLH